MSLMLTERNSTQRPTLHSSWQRCLLSSSRFHPLLESPHLAWSPATWPQPSMMPTMCSWNLFGPCQQLGRASFVVMAKAIDYVALLLSEPRVCSRCPFVFPRGNIDVTCCTHGAWFVHTAPSQSLTSSLETVTESPARMWCSSGLACTTAHRPCAESHGSHKRHRTRVQRSTCRCCSLTTTRRFLWKVAGSVMIHCTWHQPNKRSTEQPT